MALLVAACNEIVGPTSRAIFMGVPCVNFSNSEVGIFCACAEPAHVRGSLAQVAIGSLEFGRTACNLAAIVAGCPFTEIATFACKSIGFAKAASMENLAWVISAWESSNGKRTPSTWAFSDPVIATGSKAPAALKILVKFPLAEMAPGLSPIFVLAAS